MNFRTIVDVPEAEIKIGHQSRVVFAGSCFAENIGNKLKSLKIPTIINPTGIHYNPWSLADSVKLAINNLQISNDDLFLANGLNNHFNFNSEFSATDKNIAREKMANALIAFRKSLVSADYFFVTFGTSFIYTLIETNKIVTNCHKLPESKFTRKFLSIQETILIWKMLINELKYLNPKLKIVFTISPVRHFRDGAVQNQQSKSALLIAVKELCETNSDVHYFPAYEIVNDELRDYRFYASDMLHPSETAVDYIMERFSECYFSDKTTEINKQVMKIVNAARHRVFNHDTDEHRKFCLQMQSQILEMNKRFPEMDFTEEASKFY